MTIRVAVAGAAGRMGRTTVRAIAREADLALVAALGRVSGVGDDAGVVAGAGMLGVPITASIDGVLAAEPDVVVDFSPGPSAVARAEVAARAGVSPVIGGTGMSASAVESLAAVCAERGIGGLVAANFALGAVLMMEFSRHAARHFPHVEIIELHHDRKRDAPSGTAARTARLVAEARGPAPPSPAEEEERTPGVRGGVESGVRVHSVRLPGLLAHQMVIFGGPGQTLTIRHDSTSEESFMPGVLLAIRGVRRLRGLAVGLEHLLQP